MTEHPAAPGRLLPATTTTDHDAVHAAVAVLPIGAFEQHGPSLPLVTDTLIATAIAEAISQHHKVFQLPAITFGCSHEHSAFPGTVSLSPATVAAVVTDICSSLARQGVRALIVVNGHGGNYVLGNVVQQANADGAIRVGLYPSRADWTDARRAAGISSSNHDDMHAGELETSVLLAAHSSYVRGGWQGNDHIAPDQRYLTTVGIGAYTTSGVIGYPSRATAAKGHAVLDHLGQAAHALIALLTSRST
jgi:creatinine amidohydrolase